MCELHLLRRKAHKKANLTLTYVQNIYNLNRARSRCLFMARIGTYFDREQVVLALAYVVVQTNVARDAGRAGTAVSQLMSSAQPSFTPV